MPQAELTPKERHVFNRIMRLCARHEGGTVEAGRIGAHATCESLASKGCILVELSRIGPKGGRYYRYRVAKTTNH